MFNFFEQPWTLTATAGIILLILLVARPGKKYLWLWLLPFAVAALAFALDYLVRTEPEKIRMVIKTVVKAAEQENCGAIEPFISPAYRDSLHKSKRTLMAHCTSYLSEPVILKTVLRIGQIGLQNNTATVPFTVRVLFEPESYVYEFRQQMVFGLEAKLKKTGQEWLIKRIEIRKIDLMDAGWNQLR